MNRFEDLLGPLSDEAERRVSVLLAAATGTDGVLTLDELVDAVASVIASSRSQARSIALALVQEAVEESLGSSYLLSPESLTASLEGSEDLTTLASVVHGILTDAEDGELSPMRLSRLARGEVTYAAHVVTQHALIAEPAVIGWTRDLEGDACQLCRWWARDGKVWRPDHTMPTHKGCTCRQLPVVG